MTDAPDVHPPRTARGILGLTLCRVVVPLWIATGATFKLLESNPGLLPKGILNDGFKVGIDLDLLLAILITIEFAFVAAMVLLGRWARVLAAMMLTVFVLVLARELARGATNCGCLGAKSPSPWTMIGIDGAMLLGVILLKPMRAGPRGTWPYAAAAVVTLVLGAVTFWQIMPHDPPPQAAPTAAAATAASEPRVDAAPTAPTGVVLDTDPASLVGTHVSETDFFDHFADPVDDLDVGVRYVVFYRSFLDANPIHEALRDDPARAARTIAVKLPLDADPDDDVTQMETGMVATSDARLTTLAPDVEWGLPPMIALRLEGGIVTDVAGSPSTALRTLDLVDRPSWAMPGAEDDPRAAQVDVAVARTRRWLDRVPVDVMDLDSKGLDGIKHLAEILGVLAVLSDTAESPAARVALRERARELSLQTSDEAYHALGATDDAEKFSRNSMSYLRVAWLMDRFGFDVSTYLDAIDALEPRLRTHVNDRGAWQREMFYYYFHMLGLDAQRDDRRHPEGVIEARRAFAAYDLRTMYELTHWVLVAYEYGTRHDQDRLSSADLDYVATIVPELLYDTMRMPDADITAELRSCLSYLGRHDAPRADEAIDWLLRNQNADGTWGDYELLRMQYDRYVDQKYSLHTTFVAVQALVEAFGSWRDVPADADPS